MEATAPDTKPRAKRATMNRLTHAQFFKLCEYVKTISDMRQFATKSAFAKHCSDELNMAVVATTAVDALEATGRAWEKSREPRLDDCTHVARELAQLMRELGKEPSQLLLEIAGE